MGSGRKIMRSSSSLLVCALLTAESRRFCRCVFLSVLALACSCRLAAQEATIVGTVTDQTGGLVPSITITITNQRTGAARALVTNHVGQYVASGLRIGVYDVKAESSGFAVEEFRGVVLNENDRRRVDFQMKIATKTDAIVVDSNPVAVQADSGEQSSLVPRATGHHTERCPM